jgi:hypothetical protein
MLSPLVNVPYSTEMMSQGKGHITAGQFSMTQLAHFDRSEEMIQTE